MNANQFQWEQHANPRMRVRRDGYYWVIAEPATWDADDACDYAARIYYGTFPIRVAEVGFAWGDTMELALANAIAHLEGRSPVPEAPRRQNGGNGRSESTANDHAGTAAVRRQFVEEWRF